MGLSRKGEYSKILVCRDPTLSFLLSFPSLWNLFCCRLVLLRIENTLMADRRLATEVAVYAMEQRGAGFSSP